jgi:hypothetical protein
MKKLALIATIFFILCAPRKGVLIKKGQIPLSFKYTEGSERFYTVKLEILTTNVMPQITQTVNSLLEFKIRERVKSVGDTIVLIQKFEDASGTVWTGGKSQAITQIYELKGDSLLIFLRGNDVIKVEGLKKIPEDMRENFEESIKFIRTFLPEDSIVSVGDKWKREEDGDNYVYQLTGLMEKEGKKLAKIDYTIDINEDRKEEKMGMEVYLKFKGKGKGTILFDYNGGYLVEKREETSREGKVKIEDMGIETEMYMDIKSEIKVLD